MNNYRIDKLTAYGFQLAAQLMERILRLHARSHSLFIPRNITSLRHNGDKGTVCCHAVMRDVEFCRISLRSVGTGAVLSCLSSRIRIGDTNDGRNEDALMTDGFHFWPICSVLRFTFWNLIFLAKLSIVATGGMILMSDGVDRESD